MPVQHSYPSWREPRFSAELLRDARDAVRARLAKNPSHRVLPAQLDAIERALAEKEKEG